MNRHYELKLIVSTSHCRHRSIDRTVGANRNTKNSSSDDNCLRLAAPPGYAMVYVARSSLTVAAGLLSASSITGSRYCFHFRFNVVFMCYLLSRCSPCNCRSVLCTSSSCSFIDRARKSLFSSLFFFWWSVDRTWDTGRACVSRRHRRQLQRQSPAHWWLWCTLDALAIDLFWHGPTREGANTQPWKHPRSCDNAIYLSAKWCRYWTRGKLLRSLARRLQSSACRRIAVHRREAGVALTGRLCDGCWTTVNFPGHNTTTSM